MYTVVIIYLSPGAIVFSWQNRGKTRSKKKKSISHKSARALSSRTALDRKVKLGDEAASFPVVLVPKPMVLYFSALKPGDKVEQLLFGIVH